MQIGRPLTSALRACSLACDETMTIGELASLVGVRGESWRVRLHPSGTDNQLPESLNDLKDLTLGQLAVMTGTTIELS